jgi:hypothetical protein
MQPKSNAVAAVGVGLLNLPKIPYILGRETLSGMDCQGLVEYCVRTAGGTMSCVGSNDMFRNACSWIGTIAQAKAQGKLVPGAAVFVLKKDGGEPARYKADGLGNANHVGLYCGAPGAEIVSASASKGCVGTTALGQSWTHVGLLKSVDYTDANDGEPAACPMCGQIIPGALG